MKKHKTSIGGQALIEGILMKGPEKVAIAVRKPDKEIIVKEEIQKPIKEKYPILGFPFIRGAVNFVEMMVMGYKALTYSAEIAGVEADEESKFEKWLAKTFGKSLMTFIMITASAVGIVMAIGLFLFLPAFTANLFGDLIPSNAKTVFEGLLKFFVFLLYVILISRMKEIRRVFMYHGAEHKTIFCYEAGEELTVENIRKHKKYHPRCGTSFIFIVIFIGILVASFLPWGNPLLRTLYKFLLLPVVVCISYELLKLAGRYENIVTKIVSFPGILMQRFTVFEPDDDMIEVAIAAMKPVIPADEEQDKW